MYLKHSSRNTNARAVTRSNVSGTGDWSTSPAAFWGTGKNQDTQINFLGQEGKVDFIRTPQSMNLLGQEFCLMGCESGHLLLKCANYM